MSLICLAVATAESVEHVILHRDSSLWFPEVLDSSLSIIDTKSYPRNAPEQLPISWRAAKGPDVQITLVSAWIDPAGQILGLKLTFNHPHSPLRLSVPGFESVPKYENRIDIEAGEKLVGIMTNSCHYGEFKGFQVRLTSKASK